MIDFANEITLHVGEQVQVRDLDRKGSIESIRIISKANLVEEYFGSPKDIVVTIQIGDGIVNKRGVDVMPILQKVY
jgi:hypothetical protein